MGDFDGQWQDQTKIYTVISVDLLVFPIILFIMFLGLNNYIRLACPAQYGAWPESREYSVWSSMAGRSPSFSALG